MSVTRFTIRAAAIGIVYLAGGVTVACSDVAGTPTAHEPQSVRAVVTTSRLAGYPGSWLDDDVTVAIVDANGKGIAGVPVDLGTLDGGRADPGRVVSDANGIVRFRWLLGAREGAQSLTVTLRSGAVLATVVATCGGQDATTLRLVSGDEQAAAPDSLLPAPIVVQVLDGVNRPVVGEVVTLRSSGTASAGSVAITDSGGLARLPWRLSNAPGVQRRFVQVRGLAPVITSATAALGNWVELSVGSAEQHCALNANGRAYCWGFVLQSSMLQTTPDAVVERRTSPTGGQVEWVPYPAAVVLPGPLARLFGDGSRFCATRNAELWCWGAHDLMRSVRLAPGFFGCCDNRPYLIPRLLATGIGHIGGESLLEECWTDLQGRAWCFGIGEQPRQVPTPGRTWRAVAPRLSFASVASRQGIDSLGRLYLDIAGSPSTNVPPFSMVDLGPSMSCGLSAAQRIWCWGQFGALGNGVVGPIYTLSGPVEVTLPAGFAPISVSAGEASACALDATGRVACWGRWFPSAIAPIDATEAVPRELDTTLRFDRISVGGSSACGHAPGKGIFCWQHLGTPTHVPGTI